MNSSNRYTLVPTDGKDSKHDVALSMSIQPSAKPDWLSVLPVELMEDIFLRLDFNSQSNLLATSKRLKNTEKYTVPFILYRMNALDTKAQEKFKKKYDEVSKFILKTKKYNVNSVLPTDNICIGVPRRADRLLQNNGETIYCPSILHMITAVSALLGNCIAYPLLTNPGVFAAAPLLVLQPTTIIFVAFLGPAMAVPPAHYILTRLTSAKTIIREKRSHTYLPYIDSEENNTGVSSYLKIRTKLFDAYCNTSNKKTAPTEIKGTKPNNLPSEEFMNFLLMSYLIANPELRHDANVVRMMHETINTFMEFANNPQQNFKLNQLMEDFKESPQVLPRPRGQETAESTVPLKDGEKPKPISFSMTRD